MLKSPHGPLVTQPLLIWPIVETQTIKGETEVGIIRTTIRGCKAIIEIIEEDQTSMATEVVVEAEVMKDMATPIIGPYVRYAKRWATLLLCDFIGLINNSPLISIEAMAKVVQIRTRVIFSKQVHL